MTAGAANRPAPLAVVTVVGAGYVGLTTAACLAELGHRVTCTDVDVERIAGLRRGEIPMHEPGLDELVKSGLDADRLSFVVGSAEAAVDADFVYLCVPTPAGPQGGTDLSYLEAAATEIGPSLKPGAVVVNKSTAPAGTTAMLQQALQRTDVAVASNPEFLRQGSAVRDFLNPDRIVVGAADPSVAERVAALFAALDAPVLITDPASAETTKFAANAFLATKLSFTNAVAALCEAVGADVNKVLEGMGHDPRIGRDYLRPGPGWGGSCLPKDTRALIDVSAAAGYDFALLRSVVAANDAQFEQDRRQGRPPGRPRRREGRPARAGLQGRHRRHARFAGHRDSPTPHRRRCGGPGLRPCGDCRRGRGGDRHRHDGRRLRGLRPRLRTGAGHRVGRVPAARLRPDRAPDGPAPRGGRRNMLDPVALERLGFTYSGLGLRGGD